MEERIIRSSKVQLEEFRKSFIWMDILDELNELFHLAQIEYDLVGETRTDDKGFKVVPNSSETLIHLGDIKGRRKAVIHFQSIIDTLIQNIEISKEQKNDPGRE